ncbi:MAG: ubiquinone biosynthesis hydroxylase [Beijerinckiaceae bacterium]|nr:ubiquinone biosynthesis hydroxylase [Beijerinckiaceae bacterium]
MTTAEQIRSGHSLQRADIVIGGGGLAGLALALALKQAVGGHLKVIICDPAFAKPPRPDDRAFALAAGGRRMFEALGVWDRIAPEAEPIRDMVITDSRLNDPVRPVFLTFEGDVGTDEPFASMVPQGALLRALRDAAEAQGVSLRAAAVTSCETTTARIHVTLSDGAVIDAALLCACDGGASPIRRMAKIDVVRWSYEQSGIVTTIAHERPHHGRAEEHFLPSGPFAILPLPGNQSSIVWSERNENVDALLALDDEDLLAEIEKRFGLKLGSISMTLRPKAWPLNFQMARRFVAPRIALVGDSAHVIHPIAGQGLNLGLEDIAALAELIADQAALGLDVGAHDMLETYERARRTPTVAMAVVTDGLNRLFSNDNPALRAVRDFGLGLVDRMPSLKQRFIREAAASAQSPRLLRGLPL